MKGRATARAETSGTTEANRATGIIIPKMAAGHSVEDYLETIYFLAFPIGEYRPETKGSPTLAVRVADMLGVSRASAGEMLKRLEAEDAAYDIGAYRDAPPGIRIWCGATVDTADIEALGPWLDWAWEATR